MQGCAEFSAIKSIAQFFESRQKPTVKAHGKHHTLPVTLGNCIPRFFESKRKRFFYKDMLACLRGFADMAKMLTVRGCQNHSFNACIIEHRVKII